MKDPFVSIIVPVYNVEKFLRECIDSILAQSFTNFELILVDDGSIDNCPVICDEYADKDHRVKVIHKPNGGISSARNAGIDKPWKYNYVSWYFTFFWKTACNAGCWKSFAIVMWKRFWWHVKNHLQR